MDFEEAIAICKAFVHAQGIGFTKVVAESDSKNYMD